MEKVSALLIVLVMVLFVVSCSDTGETSDTGTDMTLSSDGDLQEATETTDALENRKLVSDDLPVKDFEGAEFRISATDKYDYEMDVESITGDVCDDAVYERNRLIEERFNIKIRNVLALMASGDNHGVHPDFTSKYASVETAMNNGLEKIINAYNDIV